MIFSFLEKEGMKVDEILLKQSVRIGNMYFFKYLSKKIQIPKDMLLKSVISMNTEIVKYFVENGANINMKDISSIWC